MDPRNFTIKPCPGAYAAKSGASISNSQSLRKGFGNSVGKIGDLAVLNSIGAGSIGTGLRTLASVSNSIRTGCGALPSVIGDSLDQGANWVLGHIGIAPTVIQTLQDLHPGVANQAWGQAQQIYQQIQNGHFKPTDIPSYLQDFQNLERLARGIYTPGDDRANSLTPACEASPYAIDMVPRAPKYKFLFLVQFEAAAGYSELDSLLRGMAFVVKKSSRPKITYDMEDVNYYNFRSKLTTKTEFGEMSMTFHDDTQNNSTRVYAAYLKAMTPIANMVPSATLTSGALESGGMSFLNNTITPSSAIEDSIKGNNYAASIGPLVNDNKQQIFRKIVLYHVFDNGTKATAYTFINPRISSMIPDDVDMSIGSEGCELTITFVYDTVYVETDLPMSGLNDTFTAAQTDAFYQLRNNATAGEMGPSTSGILPYGPTADGQSCDPLHSTDTRGSGSNSIASGGGFGGAIGQGLGNMLSL